MFIRVAMVFLFVAPRRKWRDEEEWKHYVSNKILRHISFMQRGHGRATTSNPHQEQRRGEILRRWLVLAESKIWSCIVYALWNVSDTAWAIKWILMCLCWSHHPTFASPHFFSPNHHICCYRWEHSTIDIREEQLRSKRGHINPANHWWEQT